MFCEKCGNKLENGVCGVCGYTPNENANINNVNPINAGAQYNMNNSQNNEQDNGGIGWWCLGCCIPIVGLVLYLVWKDVKPKTAKSAGTGALVSFIAIIAYYIIIGVLGFWLAII